MTPRIAPVLSVLVALSLALALLGHGHAQAQSGHSELHGLVICDETGGEVILVEGDGNRVNPASCADGLCAECLHAAILPTGATARHAAACVITDRLAGKHPGARHATPPRRQAHRPHAPSHKDHG